MLSSEGWHIGEKLAERTVIPSDTKRRYKKSEGPENKLIDALLLGLAKSMYSVNSLLFVVNGWVKFSALLQIRFQWVFPSPFNLDICTVNCRAETKLKETHWEKVVLTLVVSSKSVSVEFSFWVEERPDLHTPIVANKRANSHNFKTYIWIYLHWLLLSFTDWTEINICTLVVDGGE